MCYKNFYLILCLAGKGQRFLDEGIFTPKYLLADSKREKTILELILENLISSGIKNFLLVLNEKHFPFKEDIDSITNRFNEIDFSFLFIKDSSGQAETGFIGLEYIKQIGEIDNNSPVGFHNGDTILLNRDLRSMLDLFKDKGVLGIIDTFNSVDPSYSYIKLDNHNNVQLIKEKSVISNMATSGFYVFRDTETYFKYYQKMSTNNSEKFISDVYSEIILDQGLIKNIHSANRDTVILGTPKQYAEWIK